MILVSLIPMFDFLERLSKPVAHSATMEKVRCQNGSQIAKNQSREVPLVPGRGGARI